jgi:hypothetical protein
MTRHDRIRSRLLALSVCVSITLPAARAEGDAAAPEAVAGWQWYQDVSWDTAKGPRLVDFILGPEDFDHARPDLGDLRLLDTNGRTVPYALRVRRTVDRQDAVPARTFDRLTGKDHSTEVSLDLGTDPPSHNKVVVHSPGHNVRRRLVVESSNDGKTWGTLLDNAHVVHFQIDAQSIDRERFHYPESRARYLRLHLFPDRGLEDDRPTIASAELYRSVQVPGEHVTRPANLGPRQAEPGGGGPGSVWTIDFGGNRVPVERLDFDVGTEEFSRPFRIELANPDEPVQYLANGEWRRRAGETRPLEASFSEVLAQRLRLIVTDYRNTPLNLLAVRYTAPARQVIFAPAGRTPPLRLYLGNPHAQAPHYDFAASLPDRLEPAPERVELGPLTLNPDYSPPPKPWSERWPWLVYVVLSVAAAVLLAILAALARAAIARHDATRPAPGVPSS